MTPDEIAALAAEIEVQRRAGHGKAKISIHAARRLLALARRQVRQSEAGGREDAGV